MAIKIIDNKRIDLTNDEFTLYQEICKSYDKPTLKGSDLFHNLFETDENGIIVFLRPPSVRQTSMEVFLFIVVIMHQQQCRISRNEHDILKKEMNDKYNDLFNTLNNKIAELDKMIEGNK